MKRRSATATPTRVILGAGALLALVYAAFGYRAHLRNQGILEGIEALREEVFEVRSQADSCASELAMEESEFRTFRRTVDSLRAAVDAAEAPLPGGGRGVAAEGYDAYLASFNAYNTAVAEWETREEGLRDTEARCRELVERHNALTGALSDRLREHGIELR